MHHVLNAKVMRDGWTLQVELGFQFPTAAFEPYDEALALGQAQSQPNGTVTWYLAPAPVLPRSRNSTSHLQTDDCLPTTIFLYTHITAATG